VKKKITIEAMLAKQKEESIGDGNGNGDGDGDGDGDGNEHQLHQHHQSYGEFRASVDKKSTARKIINIMDILTSDERTEEH
jgi:hypothetical protein